MGDIRYIISDASKKIDVEPHALRYWEEELGLDIPRNEMGHRYYREEDVKILKNVKMLKEQGFQLKAIKMILPNIHKIDNLDAKSMLLLRNELNERVFELESKQEGKGTQVIEPMDSELQSGNEEVEKQAVAEKENGSSKVIEDNERKVEPFMKKAASDNNLIHLDDVRGEHAALSCQEGRTSIDKLNESETVSMQPSLTHDGKMLQFKSIMNELILNALKENNEELSTSVGKVVSLNITKEIDYQFREKEQREEERYKHLDETIRAFQRGRAEIAATQADGDRKKRRFKKKNYRI